MRPRAGVIGFGGIGRTVAASLLEDRLAQLTFVYARRPEVLADLVVEAAHPDIVAALGARILRTADVMPLSTGALVDDALRKTLVFI